MALTAMFCDCETCKKCVWYSCTLNTVIHRLIHSPQTAALSGDWLDAVPCFRHISACAALRLKCAYLTPCSTKCRQITALSLLQWPVDARSGRSTVKELHGPCSHIRASGTTVSVSPYLWWQGDCSLEMSYEHEDCYVVTCFMHIIISAHHWDSANDDLAAVISNTSRSDLILR